MTKLLASYAKLKGYKTYIVAGITIAYAIVVVGWQTNDWHSAATLILQALGVSALRNAIQ